MLLVDANVLLYAVNMGAREHEVAVGWLREALGKPEALGLAWIVVLAFLRLSTHPAVFPRPLTVAQAGDAVEGWLESAPVVTVDPTRRHLGLMRGLLAQAGTGGNLVGDLHLAALALEYGATVVSFDRDFARFAGVKLLRPS